MRKWLLATSSLAILASSLVGCSSKEPATQSVAGTSTPTAAATAKDDKAEKLTITMMTNSWEGGGWPEKNPIVDEINKKLNIDLKIQWVPGDNYKEKLNVMAASNEFPDVFMVYTAEFAKWIDKGLFMDLKPEIDKYPNLKKYIPENQFQFMSPKGKYYGLPYYSTDIRDSLVIRKDWLDKLGLKVPTTTDELYEVAKAFATKDPDGNGQNDTIGMSFAVTAATGAFTDNDHIRYAFGLGNAWKELNGKIVPVQEQVEETKAFASYYRKAYAEGVLDKDFAINKIGDPLEKFTAGKLGISWINPNQYYDKVEPALMKVQPKAEVLQIDPPKGPTGQRGTKTFTPGTTKFVINAKIDKKKQDRILAFMDYLLSDEGDNLTRHGIEGVHYKKTADGKFEKLDAFDKDRPYLFPSWFLRRYDPMILIRKWDNQDLVAKIKDLYTNNAKFPIYNPGAAFNPETSAKLSTPLNAKYVDTLVKVISGKEPVESIDKAVQAWKTGGGDKIVEEMNAEYVKSK
ncbi:extracellular solute-binding protein [Paenibacillus qinlingensis]|uniref:ABC-type glycerol-3-phosphate transport system substrate-binding protein n=1 Tax=Paenibacillus qinlingensis TaxID=1837343 RepID=A0ABU1NTR8_9BACL|nr:extracellular solute-binding protein [Paenibacillus qinlingensis]MDR6550859.1 ABC-type glycerol-3-phosphate transport system substrate-binding protein [Paenibacillus qinlingensis]